MRKKRAYKKTVSIVKEESAEIYERLAGNGKGFLLESYSKDYDRYTFIGAEPEEMITSGKNMLVITKPDGRREERRGNPLLLLSEYYKEFQVEKEDEELVFTGGLVGSLGYDFVRYSECLPDHNKEETGTETIQLMLITSFLVIDHIAETLTAVVLEEDKPGAEERAMEKAEDMLAKARQKKQTMRRLCHDGKIIEQSDSMEEYCSKVEKIKDYIREGHVFQTVLSQRWTIETRQSGFALYKELRELNPSPYLYYFNYGSFEVIGSSPEMLVKKQGDKVFTCPIAGTRRRGRDEAEDRYLQQELLSDEKEKAEHVMLVDLARNDMGRISEFGSVKVTRFMEVKNYSHVMHIVSKVEGRTQADRNPLELAASFIPAGTLSGAPKIRAMEIIDELENVRRGLYGGATGYIDFSGDMDLCITIRTMVKKGDLVYLQAGAGIVADSVPEKEYRECCNKVMALAETLIEEENL